MKKDKLTILYEDKYLIIVDKPAGLLSISTTKERTNTLFHKVIDYEKHKNKHNKVFIVHRLDRETSGLILLAKDEKTKFILQNNWDQVKRKYVAVVEGIVTGEGTLTNYLNEDASHLVHESDAKHGKLAITNYQSLKHTNKYSLLEITLETGRKNQIRVQLKLNNTPITGDKKYQAKKNPIGRLALHATTIIFTHPITNQVITISSKIPKEFNQIFEKAKA